MKLSALQRGFTLIELVIVMVVVGLLAGMAAVLLGPAIKSYLAVQRRAALTDQADTALRRIGREVRSAVPNSIRVPINSSNNQCFEFVPTSTGGRYRLSPDTVNAGSVALDTSQPSTGFDVLSQMSVQPSPGDYIVIDNQNGNDVYTGSNPGVRATITTRTTPAATSGTSHLNFNSQQFPSGYQSGRFVIVANNSGNPAVSYVCSGTPGTTGGNGNMTLYRVTRALISAFPATCPATTGAAILANNVESCKFVYNNNEGATQQSGFVWMQLKITQFNESVALYYGVHVDNVP